MWDDKAPDLNPDKGKGKAKSKREGTVDTNEKAVVAKEGSLTVPAKRMGCDVEEELLPISRRLRISYYPPYPYQENESRQAQTIPFDRPSSSSNTPLDPGLSNHQEDDLEMAFSSNNTGKEAVMIEDENDRPRLPREAKGKGKMKVVPELPQEVWKRIFELYYDQCAEEWQITGKMKNGVTPLLISPTLTNVATPVLYAHPHISDKQIDPFIRCVALPFRCSDIPSKKLLVHHMTVRPTPIIPNYETGEYQYIRSSIVNSEFPYLMSLFPNLDSFTLKDTFMFLVEDVLCIIAGLEYIKPKKARIELRSWDLYDSPVGQDLLAATRPNLRASSSSNSRPTPPNPSPSYTNGVPTIGSWARASGDETLRSWRNALRTGDELFLEPAWLDPASVARGANGAPAPHQAAQTFQAAQAQNTIAPHAQQARLALTFNRLPGSTGTPPTQSTTAYYSSMASFNAAVAAAAAARRLTGPSQNIDSDNDIDSDDDDNDGGDSRGSNDDDDDLDNDDNDDNENDDGGGLQPRSDSNNSGSLPHYTSGADEGDDARPLLSVAVTQDLQAGAILDGGTTDQTSNLLGSTLTASTIGNTAQGGAFSSQTSDHIADADDDNDRTIIGRSIPLSPRSRFRQVQLSHRRRVAASSNNSSTRPAPSGMDPDPARSDPSSQPTPTSLAAAAIALQRTDPDRYEEYIRSNRIDHLFLPSLDDSDIENEGSSAPPVAGPSGSGPSGSSEGQYVMDQALERTTYPSSTPNMTARDHRAGLFARQGRSDNYAVAHVMRHRLQLLIMRNWAERLQAFSFVAFDPMASLAVRAPHLDFWVNVPIEHIRVHLPRGVNSLAIFKGPKENERDQVESLETARQQLPSFGVNNTNNNNNNTTPTTTNMLDASGSAAQENRVVGGDGTGRGLVHPSNTLFEIEVNTTKEMMDDMWNRAGSELPPQVCRILAGEQDWSDVIPGRTKHTPETHPEDEYPSPKTEDYPSPTYSFASTDGGSDDDDDNDDIDDLDMDSQEPGEGYDAEAANRQMEMLAARARKM